MGYDRGLYAEAKMNDKWCVLNLQNNYPNYVWQQRRDMYEFLGDLLSDKNIYWVKRSELSEVLSSSIGYCKNECIWKCISFTVVQTYMADRFEMEANDRRNRRETYYKENISKDDLPVDIKTAYTSTMDGIPTLHIRNDFYMQLSEDEKSEWKYHNELWYNTVPYNYDLLYENVKDAAKQAGVSDLTQIRLVASFDGACESCKGG